MVGALVDLEVLVSGSTSAMRSEMSPVSDCCVVTAVLGWQSFKSLPGQVLLTIANSASFPRCNVKAST